MRAKRTKNLGWFAFCEAKLRIPTGFQNYFVILKLDSPRTPNGQGLKCDGSAEYGGGLPLHPPVWVWLGQACHKKPPLCDNYTFSGEAATSLPLRGRWHFCKAKMTDEAKNKGNSLTLIFAFYPHLSTIKAILIFVFTEFFEQKKLCIKRYTALFEQFFSSEEHLQDIHLHKRHTRYK